MLEHFLISLFFYPNTSRRLKIGLEQFAYLHINANNTTNPNLFI